MVDGKLRLPLFTLVFNENGMNRVCVGNRVIILGSQIQIFEALVWFFWILPSHSEQ